MCYCYVLADKTAMVYGASIYVMALVSSQVCKEENYDWLQTGMF